MSDKGLTIPPDITDSICLTKGLNGREITEFGGWRAYLAACQRG